MAEESRLLAIMCAERVKRPAGSRRQAAAGARRPTDHRAAFEGLVESNGGWFSGDGDAYCLACFHGAREAVECALEMRKLIRSDRTPEVGVGLHLGDVVAGAGRVGGAGVDVVKKVASDAQAGEVIITESLRLALHGGGYSLTSLGLPSDAGDGDAFETYLLDPDTGEPVASVVDTVERPRSGRGALAVAALAIAALVLVGVWFFRESMLSRTPPDAANPAAWTVSPSAKANSAGQTGASERPSGVGIMAYNLYLQGVEFLNRPPTMANLARAEEHFRAALHREKGYARALAGLCQVALMRFQLSNSAKYVDGAESRCGKALAADDSLDSIRLALADLYRQTGRANKALRLYRQVLDSSGVDTMALVGIGQAQADLGHEDKARQALTRAVRLSPGSWKAQMALGRFYYWHSRFKRATERFRQVLALTPENVEALSYLGSSLIVRGKLQSAEETLNRALALGPSRSIYRNLGLIDTYQREYQSAIRNFRKAIKLAPDDHWTWGALGRALKLAGKDARSDDAYRTAVRLARDTLEHKPGAWITQGALASYLARLGKFDAASRLIREAIAEKPHDPEIRVFAADIALLKGSQAGAIDALEAAVERGFPVALLAWSPFYRSLYDNPEFRKLVLQAAPDSRKQ